MIQRARVNIHPDDCIIVIHSEESYELAFELGRVLDHSFSIDVSKLKELDQLLYQYHVCIEKGENNV